MADTIPTMHDAPSARTLYKALEAYAGPDAYTDVVRPWRDAIQGVTADLLAPLRHLGEWSRPQGSEPWPLYELYALSRVSDALLMSHGPAPEQPQDPEQPQGPAGSDRPWPGIELENYLTLFAAVGMRPLTPTAFDPSICEIVEVEQVADADRDIQIEHVAWPALLLGDLIFQRARVRISAGRSKAAAGIADCTPLYWAYLRRHRKTDDPSIGLGSNSQWATNFRRDYRTPTGARLNVDENWPVEEPDPDDDSLGPSLTARQRHELLVNRCMTRDILPGQPEEILTSTDIYVYDWTGVWPPTTP